nr:uncharacterized protein LOC128701829 [Cherax quadricarinatus]
MASTPNQQIQILMPEKKSPPSTNNTTSPITFFFANIQGLKPATNNKIPFIRGLLAEAKAMFAAFTETHIKDHLDNEVWIPGYNLYRCDRVNRQKGGVGLYIAESLVCTELLNASNDVVEVLAVKVENQNLVIVVVYKPPDATSQQFQEQLLKNDHCLENLPAPAPNILLLGDFNLRHLKWRNIANNIVAVITPGGSSDENSHSHELLNLCTKFNLNQQIIEPTRLENTLDLIFTNNDDLIRNVTISKTIYSDHNIIEVQTCMHGAPDRQNETSHEGAFTKFNFNNKNIKWDQVNQVLTDISWEDILSNTDPNLCLEQINSVALDVCTRLIPLRKRRSRCKIERDRRSLYRRRKRITERLKEVNISEMRRETLVRE